MLVAFSCKLRGVCPSCGARRASQTAVNLVDRVLPHVPLRQWVLSVPYELRLPMARSPALLSAVVRILCSEISRLMRRLGQERGIRQGATGMVATIQLFGGSLNLNPHGHLLVLDGVYHNDGHRAVFTETRAPTQSEIAEVTRRVQARVLRELKRRGMLRDPVDARNEAEDEPIIGCAQLSLRLGKLGRVDKHGDVQPDDMDLDARFARRGKPWCADIDGYRLHAGVTVRGDDDVGRENLCRYVLRHPISLSRLSLTSDGRVAYEMKYPRRGRTHLLMDPVQFLARLASLVPPPRHPLVRYVGVLSSASRWREHVVPKPQDTKHRQARPSEPQPPSATKPTDVASTLAGSSAALEPEAQGTYRGSVAAAGTYVHWATLLRRVFDVNSMECPRCGGKLRFIAIITEPPAITRILDSLGLASSPPLPHARAPDLQLEFDPVLSVA
jgi:hypothetical protein